MFLIPGPYSPADDLLGALDHVDSARSFLARPCGEYAVPKTVERARVLLDEVRDLLIAAATTEPTWQERAAAHDVDLAALREREDTNG